MKKNIKILLASSSIYRAELLARLGLSFEQQAPLFNEDELKTGNIAPYELSRMLSQKKGESLLAKFPEHLIISSDQVCNFNGAILSKPKNEDNAINQLMQLQGQTHELTTTYSLFQKKHLITKTNATKLKMKSLTREQIQNYLQKDKPFDCAGSYKIEAFGISLFEKIESDDFTAITGLPLIDLGNELQKLGIALWN